MAAPRSKEYTIYRNILVYLDVIKFEPTVEARNTTEDAFIKTLQFYAYVSVKAVNAAGESLYVFLLGDVGFSSKSMEFKKLLNTVQETEAHLLIVSEEGLKTPVKKFLMKYKRKTLHIKDHLYVNFKVDPRRNVMVPRHTICSDDEARKILTENKVESPANLPRIRHTDPQVLWAGGHPGQIVRIERKSDIGEEMYYRLIV